MKAMANIEEDRRDSDMSLLSDSVPSSLSENSQSEGSLTAPLSELRSVEQRRNSPPSNKNYEKRASLASTSEMRPKAASPRAFWQGRGHQENRKFDESLKSMGRKSSIERLKRASRVQSNSKLFQSPDSGKAGHRPQSYHAGPPPVSADFLSKRSPRRDLVNQEKSRIPLPGARVLERTVDGPSVSGTPEKFRSTKTDGQRSPVKSSLISSYKMNSYSTPERSSLPGYITKDSNRRPKSVTFDKQVPHVVEFEQITPEPSVGGSPGLSYGSDEDEDEYDDLENTPVIEPDIWGRGSAEMAHDPFRSTPSPNSRPLPPIPGVQDAPEDGSPPCGRPLPTLPFAAGDLIDHPKLSLEEKMNLMKIDESGSQEAREADEVGENLLDLKPDQYQYSNEYAADRHESMSPVPHDRVRDELPSGVPTRQLDDIDFEATSFMHTSPPQLSRDSIRQEVQERRDSDHCDGTEAVEAEYAYYRGQPDAELSTTAVKLEAISDDEIDVYDVPETQEAPVLSTQRPDDARCARIVGHDKDEQDISLHDGDSARVDDSRGGDAPTVSSPLSDPSIDKNEAGYSDESRKSSLPEIPSGRSSDGPGLQQFMDMDTSLTTHGSRQYDAPPSSSTTRNFAESLKASDNFYSDESCDDDTGSVIRHEVYRSEEEEDEESVYGLEEDELMRPSSPIAESMATIRAPGGTLKTRASATPADMAAMAAARRQVSGDQSIPPVPRVPAGYRSEGEATASDSESDSVAGGQSDTEGASGQDLEKKCRKVSSTLPALGEFDFDLGLDDLKVEFDRLIEKEKRGYLMRQNTKVIHATSDDLDKEPSETKHGHARGQSWSVEPWRTSSRRRSQRDSLSYGGRKRQLPGGPVPPLPGQASVTNQRLPSVAESDTGRSSITSAEGDNIERGRLFVKVLGVKDLSLPLPQSQPTYFCLTLDNGLHCVTTSWLELGKNAPIGQEFELVVLNDLEFQLTLQVKLEAPPPPPKAAPRTPASKPKQSAFSKVFSSPKKRKQLEQRQQELAKQQHTPTVPVTAWDLLHGLVARDGSFARSYVTLKDFEARAYGRPFTTEIHCFNEWSIDTTSIKSKKGTLSGLQPARKAPYKIGRLEVQLFFVPKSKGVRDEMPKSMNTAIRELREAEAILSRKWQGFLSQQGGDCPYWRRRFFKLEGVRLTAYHEATHQPRASINLSKATKLIDDRNTLVDPTVKGPGKSRRKSGFSEEEEGYMFVEEGFRIRFANGEVIDFYADSAEDKLSWMKVLSEIIGHAPDSRGWCQVVLSREMKTKADRESQHGLNRLRKAQQQMLSQVQCPGASSSNPKGTAVR